MEFLRFGSSIPGAYWGCCACCIIQNFKVDPDAKASIQLVNGDGGHPITNNNSEMLFAGPTWRDIFHQRIKNGTFDSRDMPNHAFFAILTENQIASGVGVKWLAILKEAGFEFIRSVSNSVYTGASLASYSENRGSNKNYIFGLIRNIGTSGDGDSLTPPSQWTALGKTVPEAWELISHEDRKKFAKEQHRAQTERWKANKPAPFMTEKQLQDANVPVTMAGLRSQFPQELKELREQKKQVNKGDKSALQNAAPSSPFPSTFRITTTG